MVKKIDGKMVELCREADRNNNPEKFAESQSKLCEVRESLPRCRSGDEGHRSKRGATRYKRLLLPLLVLFIIATLVVSIAMCMCVMLVISEGEKEPFSPVAPPPFAVYIKRPERHLQVASEFDFYRSLPRIPFTYLISPRRLCAEQRGSVGGILLVKTVARDVERRRAIRQQWQAEVGHSIRIGFLLGWTNSMQKEVESESRRFHDLIQVDYQESYGNLTYKVMSGIKWTLENCQGARYIMVSDVDVYLKPGTVMEFIERASSLIGARFMACRVASNSTSVIPRPPYLCPKWCAQKYEFWRRRWYPRFCHGALYITTRKLMLELYTASSEQPYYRMDDVYLTGLVGNRIPPFPFIDIPLELKRHGMRDDPHDGYLAATRIS